MNWTNKHSLKGKRLKEHEKLWGEYNDFPPNWQEITEAEFAQSEFFTYDPKVVEFRQMMQYREPGKRHEGPCVGCHLYFFFNKKGFAIVNDYWKKTVKYYKFYLCEHKRMYECTTLKAKQLGVTHFGRCYHVYHCPDCGHVESHDSSD